jgi:hypothetical protein
MADYTKATNFTAKDGLPTGNAGKIVKGTEIDTELTAVSNAIASKADINSPTFTGTPAAPTASAGTNTTQVATTAHVFAERTNTATLTNKTLTSPTINTPTISTPAITGGTITGITDLTVADGGTGRSTLAANAVLVGNGTSGINSVAPSTSGNILVSNGTAWTSNTIQSSGIKLGLGITGEVWTDLTSSRALNTVYTNSNTYPIMIVVIMSNSGNTSGTLSVNGLRVGVWQAVNSNGVLSLPTIVPPGGTYEATSAFGTGLVEWRELF